MVVVIFLLANTWFGMAVIALFYYPTMIVVWVYNLLPWWGWIIAIFIVCCLTPDPAESLQWCVQAGIAIVVIYCSWSVVSSLVPMAISSWINTFYPGM